MDFLEKLDILMERDSYNKNSLSKASGIPYTTIDNWYKRGYDNLQLPTIKKLCSFFDTSLDFWLKEQIEDPNYGKTNGFTVNYDEMEYIKKYRILDTHGKDIVDTVLNKESERMAELENESTAAITPMRVISYYQRIASAGNGQVIFTDMPVDRVEIPDKPEYKRVSYAIGVNGNSMEPLYYDGDILLVEPTYDILEGEIGIFIVGNEAFVKKLGKEELISLNKGYDNIPLTEDSKCMGRVVDKLTI